MPSTGVFQGRAGGRRKTKVTAVAVAEGGEEEEEGRRRYLSLIFAPSSSERSDGEKKQSTLLSSFLYFLTISFCFFSPQHGKLSFFSMQPSTRKRATKELSGSKRRRRRKRSSSINRNRWLSFFSSVSLCLWSFAIQLRPPIPPVERQGVDRDT